MKITGIAPSVGASQRLVAPGQYLAQKSGGARAQAPGQALSRPYDFTNMTPERMQAAMADLIGSGRMSFDESSSLVGMIPTALAKVVYDGKIPVTYHQPKNFLDELARGIEGAELRGDTQNAASLRASLSALMRSQNAAPSVSIRRLDCLTSDARERSRRATGEPDYSRARCICIENVNRSAGCTVTEISNAWSLGSR